MTADVTTGSYSYSGRDDGAPTTTSGWYRKGDLIMRREILYTALILLVALNAPAYAQGLFAPKVDYAVGDNPTSVFSADLDGDGDKDLVVANFDSYNVSVLLNNGDATFAPKVDYVGNAPYSVFSVDLDDDGDNDLAVANRAVAGRDGNNVSVLMNNGNGTFAAKVDYAVAFDPYSVFSADLDGDGDNDLAVANLNSPNIVSILLNNGDGTFANRVDYTAGDGPISVFSADLDGDRDNDLAVANWRSGNVSVLLNLSTMPPPPVVTSINPISGTELGGTPLTIAGSFLRSGATVTFDDSTATEVVVLSDTIITITTPAHPAGTVSLIVINPNGLADTLFNAFEFLNVEPRIADVSVSRPLVPLGYSVVVFAHVTDVDGIDSVYVVVRDPNDATFVPVHLTLFDDGLHDDGNPADGYWASEPWVTPGDHPRVFYVDITATDNLGAESHIDSLPGFETAISVSVGVGEEIATPGGQAVVPILASDLTGQDVVAGEIILRFNPAILQFLRAFPNTAHSFLSDGFGFSSPEPGEVIIVFASPFPLFDTAKGILASAVFQVNPQISFGQRINVFVDQVIINEGAPPVIKFDGGITVELVGDVSRNGEIRAFDAALVLMHSIQIRDIIGEFFGGDVELFLAVSDVTRNGEVTSFDASRILRFLLKLIPGLPFLGHDGLAKIADVAPRVVSVPNSFEAPEKGISVPISIDDMSGVLGADISISYDASKLRAMSASPSDLLSSFMFQSNIQDDKVRIAFASVDPVEGGGDIAYIEFEILPGVGDKLGDDLISVTDVQLNEGLIPAVTERTELSLAVIPETHSLSQNYPNPFNPETVVHYDLPIRSNVNISVFNMMGQKVATLVDKEMDAGSHSVVWNTEDDNGESLASGVYLYRMEADGFVQARKLVLIR